MHGIQHIPYHTYYCVCLPKKSKQIYLFSHCFGNSNYCVQIKSCDNSIHVIHFITSLEGSHSVLGENIPVSCFEATLFYTDTVNHWFDLEYWYWNFYAARNAHMNLFLQPHPCTYKTLTLKKFLASAILYRHGASKAVQK